MLKQDGMGIIFITHFLDQVFSITDRVTILRNGQLVGEYETKNLTRLELVTRMVGKSIEDISTLKRARPSDVAKVCIEADCIGIAGEVEEISLEVKDGEMLGFAGLLGSGRTETARMLFGERHIQRGRIKKRGKALNIRSPRDAIDAKIAFCPEDRKRDGVIGDLTIRENIILAIQATQGMLKPMPRTHQEELADKYIKLLGIATPDAEKKVGELSGGNQQKVILARWLATNPDVFILDEPTRGIDVGAKAEIQRWMIQLCEEGRSVIFISSELDEVIRCSSRILVMNDMKKAAEIPGDDATQAGILSIIAKEETV
jgi:simple sugar transport system ATP-binding protein